MLTIKFYVNGEAIITATDKKLNWKGDLPLESKEVEQLYKLLQKRFEKNAKKNRI